MDFKANTLNDEVLTPINKYLADDEITNIDWNGNELWIKDVYNRCYRVDDPDVTANYIHNLIAIMANSKGINFNKESNTLQTDNEELHMRITAVHNSIAPNGDSLLIRRTTEKTRFTYKELVESGYISERNLNLLINCVISGCNIIVAGIPEAGKSEFGKYLSLYIPDNENVVTIEDALEWYYKKLKPDAACISLKINDVFSYREAITLCMRLNPSRILFTEVRSSEIEELAALWTSGVPGITTTHSGNYRSIPDRLINLLENKNYSEQIENNIYENLDVGVVIKKRKNPDGTATRYIDEIGFFERVNKKNNCVDYMIKGTDVSNKLPDKILKKFEESNIKDPFYVDDNKKI